MISDPYKILGVSPSSSDEEISKAYRRLAKKYHPDLNQGSPDAAKKMSEINAAYEQVKGGKAYQGGGSYYGGGAYQRGYGGGSGAGSGGYAGQSTAGGYGPFGGFGGFGGFEDIFGAYRQRSRGSPFDPVMTYIRAGYYREALTVLSGMSERGGEWYYWSAIANYGMGNNITALNHAKTAVQMEPDNGEYQRVLNQIQNGSRVYRQQSQSYGMPAAGVGKYCLGLCLMNLLFRFCCFGC